ncbi:MAG: ABC transporter ATP-binding protein [Deltaproteobacteria bacterium]|nr:ABC transporter ATP-binding protein [Deltaproteobacteria bacterium]
MLEARNVFKTFRPSLGIAGEIRKLFGRAPQGGTQAVRGVSLQVFPREILGIVGESGSGKSTLGRLFSSLLLPERGEVLFEGKNLQELTKAEKLLFRRKVQFMFQDPASSLNPRLTAGRTLAEGLVIHKIGNRASRQKRVLELLGEVGLDPSFARRYPHQFSGGQRQRLSLARALSLNPEILIADEPASALDVSVQAQIVNLLLEEQKVRGLALVIISHDLALVSLIATRVAIMYGGLLMELIPQDLLGHINHHPYVKALWASAESSLAKEQNLILEGEPPDPENPPPGCPFAPRCPEAQLICQESSPPFKEDIPGHSVACFSRGESAPAPPEASPQPLTLGNQSR